MLVLSRRRDQAIMIGDDVEITVVDIRGDKVRLGIRASETVSVHRREIYDQIKAENRAAAEMKPADLAGLPPGHSANPTKTALRAVPAYTPDRFLLQAVDEAKRSLAAGGLPIGAVLVRKGEIIAVGHDQRVQQKNATAHAELVCLTNAGKQPTYADTILYTTLMPCHLCSGAIVQLGIPKVVIGESAHAQASHVDFLKSHGITAVIANDPDCVAMVDQFIREHGATWNEAHR